MNDVKVTVDGNELSDVIGRLVGLAAVLCSAVSALVDGKAPDDKTMDAIRSVVDNMVENPQSMQWDVADCPNNADETE